MSKIRAQMRLSDELEVWTVDSARQTVLVRIRPVNPRRYFTGRPHVDLTLRELEAIVAFVKAN